MTWPSFFHTASIGFLCWLPIGAVLRWRHRGQAFNELLALSDTELKDIGVCRGSIPAIGCRQHDWTRMTP